MKQDVIDKFHRGDCTQEECMEVLTWYMSKDSNKQLAEEIGILWEDGEAKHVASFEQKDDIFNKLSDIIIKDTPSHQILEERAETQRYLEKRKHRTKLYWSAIAAAVLLAIVSTFVFTQQQSDEPVAVTRPQYISKSTPKGSKLNIKLGDGSMVKLNSDSRIWFQSDFNNLDVREVYLEGEAFFDVAKNPNKPFKVYTGQVETRVLGTSFNIKAYSPGQMVNVAVVTGNVEVTDKGNVSSGNQPMDLLPNEQATVSPGEKKMQKSNFDYIEVVAWKDDLLHFKNASFDQVMDRLEIWYGVKFVLQNKKIEKGFSGTYDDKSLEHVLEGVSYVLNFDYEINGKVVIIK